MSEEKKLKRAASCSSAFETPSKIQKTDTLSADAIKSVRKNEENYKMNHQKRGKAVIFNHYYCEGHRPRRGSELDVERLRNVLKTKLLFDVEVHCDLTYCEMQEVLQRVSKEDFTENDCLALFVMTHGSLNQLKAKDKAYAVEELWTFFTPKRCVTLTGKPKLFFINACRGKMYDEGVLYQDEEEEEEEEEQPEDSCEPYEATTKTYRVPICADFLTIYSTVKGYTSFRHPREGSWFIQSLCETLENDEYIKLELKQILTVATRITALKCNDYSETVTQIPTMMSTLMRNLYFL